MIDNGSIWSMQNHYSKVFFSFLTPVPLNMWFYSFQTY